MSPASPCLTRQPGAEGAGIPADDSRLMRLAIALGERNLGRTWPNPSVGGVVVDERHGPPLILAQGVTRPGGRPHAEPVALAAAGAAARGSTFYVSLEPCSHHGGTPPCVDAILDAGIARVVTALEDPDPRVAGRGHARLRQAGIEVATGILSGAARRAHRGHISRVTRGRPWVTLKLARTSDGYAARLGGPRLLVTGDDASRRVHLMRAHADAVMVGIGTLVGDDPLLTVRLPGLSERSPVRVVVDGALRTSVEARVVATAREVPTWVLANADAPLEAEQRLAAAGAQVFRTAGEGSRIDVAAALALLADRGITSVLAEGGPALAEALAERGLVDELMLLTSPRALGHEGVLALGMHLRQALADAFRLVRSESAGLDRIETFARAG